MKEVLQKLLLMIVVIPFLFTGCGGGGGAGQKVKFFLWQFSCWMRLMLLLSSAQEMQE
jgi:hypothetical protein